MSGASSKDVERCVRPHADGRGVPTVTGEEEIDALA